MDRFRDTVLAAQDYADAESTSLASLGIIPPTIPKFTIFKSATINPDGTAFIPIEPGHGDRLFDSGIVLFFEIGIAIGAAHLRLNSCGAKKCGRDNIYPRFDIQSLRRLNMQVSRIVADPSPGRRVRENSTDHRNYLREGLRTDRSPSEHGPNKYYLTRQDAIEALLEAYDLASSGTREIISRSGFQHLLVTLLHLADCRASFRLSSKAGATIS